MNEQILDQIYEGYEKYMKETRGYFTCCSKVEFRLIIYYLCNAMIALMGNDEEGGK